MHTEGNEGVNNTDKSHVMKENGKELPLKKRKFKVYEDWCNHHEVEVRGQTEPGSTIIQFHPVDEEWQATKSHLFGLNVRNIHAEISGPGGAVVMS